MPNSIVASLPASATNLDRFPTSRKPSGFTQARKQASRTQSFTKCTQSFTEQQIVALRAAPDRIKAPAVLPTVALNTPAQRRTDWASASPPAKPSDYRRTNPNCADCNSLDRPRRYAEKSPDCA